MLSLLAIPGLLSTSTPLPAQALAQQWAGIYNRGKVLGPQTAVLAVLGYGYLAYNAQHRTGSVKGSSSRVGYFAGAAALTLAIVPFTVAFMDATNQALLGIAAGGGAAAVGGGEGSQAAAAVGELLVKWKGLNLIRSLWPLAGAVVGFWGLVG